MPSFSVCLSTTVNGGLVSNGKETIYGVFYMICFVLYGIYGDLLLANINFEHLKSTISPCHEMLLSSGISMALLPSHNH